MNSRSRPSSSSLTTCADQILSNRVCPIFTFLGVSACPSAAAGAAGLSLDGTPRERLPGELEGGERGKAEQRHYAPGEDRADRVKGGQDHRERQRQDFGHEGHRRDEAEIGRAHV